MILDSYQYYQHTGSVATGNDVDLGHRLSHWPTKPIYPNGSDGLTPDTTSYTYTWWDVPGTDAPKSR